MIPGVPNISIQQFVGAIYLMALRARLRHRAVFSVRVIVFLFMFLPFFLSAFLSVFLPSFFLFSFLTFWGSL